MVILHLVVSSLLLALLSGFLGSLLGLGGGMFLVPLLILLLRVPIHTASGASILAVVATSTASTSSYIREGLTNLRLGVFLELSTTLGALSGAFLTAETSESLLRILLGILLLFAAFTMIRRMGEEKTRVNDPFAARLRLNGHYFDRAEEIEVTYGVDKVPFILLLSYVAGVISGLLGIGGGGIKVPAMNLLGRVPMKAAIATSSFMTGITAAATALIYMKHGYLDPFIVASVVLGALLGASLGSRITPRVRTENLKRLLVAILVIMGLRMISSGVSIWGA